MSWINAVPILQSIQYNYLSRIVSILGSLQHLFSLNPNLIQFQIRLIQDSISKY